MGYPGTFLRLEIWQRVICESIKISCYWYFIETVFMGKMNKVNSDYIWM